MSFLSAQHVSAGPGDRLRDAAHVTANFLSDIIPTASRRIPSDYEVKSARIERLVESHAWTDAALALVELELPQWQVRRLAYDGGEWFCSLSRQRELPDWLDESVEAHHADLAQAILGALADARRITAQHNPGVSAVAHDSDPFWDTICSENFG
jgi:hypothetical protein